jgi:VanZ family protein
MRTVVFSRWLPVAVWMGVIFAFSAVPSLNSGLGGWDLVLRKCAHMTEYGILAALVVRASGSYAVGFALAVAYACTDELHQTFVRGRHGSPIDVCIDAAGALIGLGVYLRATDRDRARRLWRGRSRSPRA